MPDGRRSPAGGGDPAYRAGKQVGQLHRNQVLLLGDSKGRLWVNGRYGKPRFTRFFDTTEWHNMDFWARSAFEDSAGRIFLAENH